MVTFQLRFVANVGQASDMVLFAFVLVVPLVVGLVLIAVDAIVGRLRGVDANRRRLLAEPEGGDECGRPIATISASGGELLGGWGTGRLPD